MSLPLGKGEQLEAQAVLSHPESQLRRPYDCPHCDNGAAEDSPEIRAVSISLDGIAAEVLHMTSLAATSQGSHATVVLAQLTIRKAFGQALNNTLRDSSFVPRGVEELIRDKASETSFL